jgi:hypothetical protein
MSMSTKTGEKMFYLPFFLHLLGCPNPPDPNQTNAPSNGNNNTPNNPPGNQGGNQGGNPPNDAPPQNANNGGGENNNQGGAPPPGDPTLGGVPAENGIIQDSVIIHIVGEQPDGALPTYTQEQLASVDNVTLSGSIACEGDDCEAPMILRVLPFLSPDGDPTEITDGTITIKALSSLGQYSILLPKSDSPVVFELLVDLNEDGSVSKGDRMAVLERGGNLIPSSDLQGVNFNTTNQEENGPLGGPVAPHNQIKPSGEEEPPPPPDKQGEEPPPPDGQTGEEGPPPPEGYEGEEPPPADEEPPPTE